jgi:hypothetical protein
MKTFLMAGLADNGPAVTSMALGAAVVELAGVPALTAPPQPKFTTQKKKKRTRNGPPELPG